MNGADGEWTPDEVAAMIGDPFYAALSTCRGLA